MEDAPSQEYSDEAALAVHRYERELMLALVRLLECPQCSNPLNTPVTLPCGRTVCRKCLPEPKPRANISYPNTPDRLFGIACPLSQCGGDHAAAECNVDVTLANFMDICTGIIKHNMPVVTDLLAPMELEPIKPKATEHMSPTEDDSIVLQQKLPQHNIFALQYKQSLADYQESDSALIQQLRGVAQKELDCLVCYNIMLDPTTTSCGHTFCRRCLARVMDHSSLCPMCRRSLHMPASLRDQSSNLLINTLLDMLCADLLSARKLAVKAEEQPGDEGCNTPLFVCTLALPSMPTFLHVFEPRYRLMMRRCVEGNRQFGMVMYNRTSAPQGDLGPTQFLEYGTLLEIVNLQTLRDGRSFVETRGIGRFKIRAHGMLDGYHVGRVERIEDISLAEEGSLEQSEVTAAKEFAERFQCDHPGSPIPLDVVVNQCSTQQLLENCMAFVRQMREASAPWLSARIVSSYGEPPDDPALFPYWFASVVPIAEEEKYVLLRTTRVRERLMIVYSWIRRIRGQGWPSGSACNVL